MQFLPRPLHRLSRYLLLVSRPAIGFFFRGGGQLHSCLGHRLQICIRACLGCFPSFGSGCWRCPLVLGRFRSVKGVAADKCVDRSSVLTRCEQQDREGVSHALCGGNASLDHPLEAKEFLYLNRVVALVEIRRVKGS